MTADLIIGRERISLGPLIGKGGEGEVYRLLGGPTKAVKLYTGKPDCNREAKVRAMVDLRLAQSSDLVGFPQEVIYRRSGEFAGFTMRLVEGHRPVHDLYGVKSRKLNFPQASYLFLIAAATNMARAIAQVHSSGCVIGDINHSDILVSENATIALIDADSFQIKVGSHIFRCLVGVPDFTPPELQGRSLSSVIRTREHDRFGLAVAIFQLLFMGSHPYSGKGGGDLSLEGLIAKNLFAYARGRSDGISPPPNTATLDDVAPEIADAFDRAFGHDPQRRPSAEDWIRLLTATKGQLSRCKNNPMHFHIGGPRSCPWCRIEAGTGVVFFLMTPGQSPVAGPEPGLPQIDVTRIMAEINAIVIPNPKMLFPPLPALPVDPSQEAQRCRGGHHRAAVYAGSATLTMLLLSLCFVSPSEIMWWLAGIGVVWLVTAHRLDATSVALCAQEFRRYYGVTTIKWEQELKHWRSALGIEAIVSLRQKLRGIAIDYRNLFQQKSAELVHLEKIRRQRELDRFLDQAFINKANIPLVTPAKVATLASFGIETAADVNSSAIMGISGFGPVTTNKLLEWGRGWEQRFVDAGAISQQDLSEKAKIDAHYSSKANDLANQISTGYSEMIRMLQSIQHRLGTSDAGLDRLIEEGAQIEVDLRFLGAGSVTSWMPASVSGPAGSTVNATWVPPPQPQISAPLAPTNFMFPSVSPQVGAPGLAAPAASSWNPKPNSTRVSMPARSPQGGTAASSAGLQIKKSATTLPLNSTQPLAAVPMAPDCPKCGRTMVKRIAQRGTRAGRPFWGCAKYPGCTGTRDIGSP